MTNQDFTAQHIKSLAKLALNPDTDWHEEAHMYAECLGKVREFCDMQHSRRETWWKTGFSAEPCPCPECTIRRRILRIIADNLK
jgi:hypothetical protein